jgi:hypothetical protein
MEVVSGYIHEEDIANWRTGIVQVQMWTFNAVLDVELHWRTQLSEALRTCANYGTYRVGPLAWILT